MKRILDIQLQEREDKKKWEKYGENAHAEIIRKDVDEFNSTSTFLMQKQKDKFKTAQKKLVDQIEERKRPKMELCPELLMNTQVLKKIQGL